MKDYLRQMVAGLWAGALWVNAIISTLLLVERTYLTAIPRWIFVITLVLSSIMALTQTFGPMLVRSHFARDLIWILLEDFMTGFPDDRQNWALRCNVMRLHKGMLTTVAAWPERTMSSKDIKWTTQQGCCGLAVRKNMPIVQDLSAYSGKSYDYLLDQVDGLPKWGMTREQWDHTRDLMSIISVPLMSVGVRPQVIGVLNFDARVTLEVWLGPGGTEAFLNRVQIIRRVLAITLQAMG